MSDVQDRVPFLVKTTSKVCLNSLLRVSDPDFGNLMESLAKDLSALTGKSVCWKTTDDKECSVWGYWGNFYVSDAEPCVHGPLGDNGHEPWVVPKK